MGVGSHEELSSSSPSSLPPPSVARAKGGGEKGCQGTGEDDHEMRGLAMPEGG